MQQPQMQTQTSVGSGPSVASAAAASAAVAAISSSVAMIGQQHKGVAHGYGKLQFVSSRAAVSRPAHAIDATDITTAVKIFHNGSARMVQHVCYLQGPA